ncbi:hypothetical protein [uncultured Kosakonia sp.]|uniref:hypothetical protein n=1 Tax=uncultured Kosakonia sp. TaxID=1588927 RepID=UPI00259904C5|nr:hypothetical protein [uncultured Kosakonia sp.]MDV5357691.1 hypothetical protein [Enterobacter asburiae]
MLDNFKLTFWDLGTYLTVGFFSFTLILYYAISAFGFDLMFFLAECKDYSSVIVILLPIVFLFLGMLIEPFANYFSKKLENKCGLFKPKENRNKAELDKLIEINLPNDNIKFVNKYRYCKAIVELKFPSSNHDLFLSRFGFYRSMSFVMAILFIANIIIGEWSFVFLTAEIFIGFLFYIFFKRSQVFRNHMEQAVYYNYLALTLASADKENQVV